MAGFMEKSISFIQNFIPRSKKFVADTISELKKSSWPPKNELMESTLLVMVSVVILGLFVAGIDWLIMLGLNALVTK